ncbi:hypothetical protein RB595_008200 [Gaeumannomyces hyphopodioides]
MSSSQTASAPAGIHVRLAEELRGRTIVVPNMLGDILQGWPSGRVNPHYVRLKHVVEGMLDSSIPEAWYRKKLSDSDFALFTAIWYPNASWEDLHTMSLLTVWAFVWDDTFDTGEQDLAGDYERGCAFRAQTLAYCRYWLGLEMASYSPSEFPTWPSCPSPPPPSSSSFLSSFPWRGCRRVLDRALSWLGYRFLPPPPPNVGCALFKALGEALCARFDEKQRRRVYSQIEFWVGSTEEEQRLRIQGSIPTYEDYLRFRQGTTAFRIFSLVGEIATVTNIPSIIMDSPEMGVIMTESNLAIIIINDILSFKKEMATLAMINLVPVMHHHGNKSLDAIVESLCLELMASRQRFEAAASALARMAAREEAGGSDKSGKHGLQDELQRFIDTIKTSVTGTWEYTVAVPRYGIQKYMKPDGSVEITL